MAFRGKKTGKIPAGAPEGKPVRRDYVEEIRKRAEKLGNTRAGDNRPVTGDDFGRRQQEQIEKHMARLRSETVRARHLAQNIDNLSQDVAVRKRNRAMTDTPIVAPGQNQRQQRRNSDKPRASTKTSAFNPLHPSMELPPEELIRLLGLESKKLRKERKKSGRSAQSKRTKQSTPTVTPEDGLETLTSQHPDTDTATPVEKRQPDTRTPSTRRRRQSMETPVFGEQRRNLLIPAVAIGLVAGIALSAYLFWMKPASEQAAVDTTPGKPVAVNKRPATPAERKAPVNQVKRKATPAPIDDPAWQATIRAQEKRLRADAEKRFKERMAAAKSAPAMAAPVLPVEAPVTPPTVAAPPPPPSADSPAAAPVVDGQMPGVPETLTAKESGAGAPAQAQDPGSQPQAMPATPGPADSTVEEPAPATDSEYQPEDSLAAPVVAPPGGQAMPADQPAAHSAPLEPTGSPTAAESANSDLF